MAALYVDYVLYILFFHEYVACLILLDFVRVKSQYITIYNYCTVPRKPTARWLHMDSRKIQRRSPAHWQKSNDGLSPYRTLQSSGRARRFGPRS